jgi:hypothetical protein
VANYVEPGASATDDKRLAFQRRIGPATTSPPAFDVIPVPGFSCLFRDQFEIEFSAARPQGRVSDPEIDLISSGY